MPVECQGSLWPQLEQMQLSGEDLLSGGHRGQIELVLHLFTAHWNRFHKIILLSASFHSDKKQTNNQSINQTYLTFVKEAANDVALQQVWVLGHSVDVSHRVVQV